MNKKPKNSISKENAQLFLDDYLEQFDLKPEVIPERNVFWRVSPNLEVEAVSDGPPSRGMGEYKVVEARTAVQAAELAMAVGWP